MKSFQLMAHGNPGVFQLNRLPDPMPGPDEVVIDVRACGLNRLDLWMEEGGLPVRVALPRTPGGEVAGLIARVGDQVRGWVPGQRVAVQSNLFCGRCEFCREGRESLCLAGELLGVNRDGGFATEVVVPSAAVVALPGTVSFECSAALTLAGSTAMHMLTRRATVVPGQTMLAIGASSGVGSAAIQIARTLGARVITTGSTREKREFGLSLGAEHAVDSSDAHWPVEVRRLTGRRGVDLVIEHVGGPVLNQCFQCLARGGTMVTCGATAGREVPLNLWPFFVKEHRLIGSYGRDRVDIEATLSWASLGRLTPKLDSVFPLERADEAFARLRSRRTLGKVLVQP